jgi:hypothetical protein
MHTELAWVEQQQLFSHSLVEMHTESAWVEQQQLLFSLFGRTAELAWVEQ